MIFNDIIEAIEGQKTETVHGLVVLMKKNVLDLNDHKAAIGDDISESIGNIIPFLDKQLSFQLVSSTISDPVTGRGKVGEKANLEDWITTLPSLAAGELHFNIKFKWGEDMGVPGAVIVNNHHPNEFYLKSITLLDLKGKGQDLAQGPIYFNCYSWVYPVEVYKSSRVFFANNTYLPSSTPVPLRAYRHDELVQLRGDNINCELKAHHRVYRYAYYNDLGKPDEGEDSARPVLGGSQEYPYPRRGRTGRRPSAADPHSESRLNPIAGLDIYVPRDERFGHIKFSDFLAFALKSFAEGLLPGLKGYLTHRSFDTFEEVLSLYKDGLPLPDIPREFWKDIPFELVKEILRFDGNRLSFPVPQIIQEDTNGWRNDEEFGRQMLAGLNPVIIQRLKEFPPTSKLDPEEYGNHESSITAADIIKSIDGLTVDQALEKERLFILDHHDTLMPYLNRINTHTNSKIYATRTLLFLKDDCTLKPIAIELSLPHMKGEQHGAFSKVYTPPKLGDSGVEKSIWDLAKAFVAVNDSGVHQLISHWLNTHAVMEPFVIATNRQLSVIHPIHKLLSPHFRDTMNINAMARQILISAGGVLEMTVFPGRFAMEMSSVIYKDWKLTEQGLPDDLLKRGLAVEDHSKPHKLRLLIEDYPYAVDGLAIWSAIETWVTEYCSIYYPDDTSIGADNELQTWWKEIREVGHGDKKDEYWWPKMQSVSELNKICTTIIWVGSALHAAVNFGQYPYAGYLPNRPTLSRRLMPKEGSPEYKELMSNPDKVFLHTITGQFETVVGVGLIEILSRHSSDEVYLGQRNSSEWTSDKRAKDALDKFRQNLIEIEKQIVERNNDKKLKNRRGSVNVPYTLLYPNTSGFGYAGMNIITKVSLNRGMSHYVLVVYRHAFATLSIAPFALILERKARPKITFTIFMHIFVLALLGPVIDQNFYYAGLKFTSPTFSCAMSNMLPAMTFVMAVIFRMEKLDIKKVIYQAKVAGSLVTVAGAMLMTLYKGPIVEMVWTRHMLPHQSNGAAAASPEVSDKDWFMGSIFLIIATLAWASLFILQTATLKKYSAQLSLTTLICFVGTLQAIVVTFVMERKPSVWGIGWDINLLAAAYAGIVTSSIAYYVQGMVIQKKGPVFASAFSPLMMIIVAIMGSCILAEKIYLGSILGGVLIVGGLYSVLWGKYKENKETKEKKAMSLPYVIKGIEVMDIIELEKVEANKMVPDRLSEAVLTFVVPMSEVAMKSKEEITD